MALAVLLAAGTFFVIGGAFDLLTDARGNLPSDHSGTFQAVAHLSWQHARVVAHPITRYVTRAEAAYSAFQLLFGVLLLAVVAIPLRRGESWAWWCCWLLIPGFAAFGAVYGSNDSANLWAAIAATAVAALALLVLRAPPSAESQATSAAGVGA